MAWVEVWLAYSEPIYSSRCDESYWWWNEEDRWKVKSLGPVTSVFEREDIALSPHKVLLGRCEATPKAVAGLAKVSETTAGKALTNFGKPVFLGEVSAEVWLTIVTGCYLVICPA